MANPYFDLSAAMFRTGILGYGGGPSTVPLFRHEAVNRYRWLSDEEFGEVLAIANTLPGPIATKLAAYLGYREKGAAGALVSVLAHILPTCVAMVGLYAFIEFFSNSAVISGMIAAVVPVVAVMLGQMAYEFGEKAVKGLGVYVAAASLILSYLLLEVIQLHPALVIVVFLAYGTVHHRVMARWKAYRTRTKKGGEA